MIFDSGSAGPKQGVVDIDWHPQRNILASVSADGQVTPPNQSISVGHDSITQGTPITLEKC